MRHLPLFGLAALLVGALAGTVAGHATVAGIKPDAVVTQRLAGAYGIPVVRDAAYDALPSSEPVGDEPTCTDCSDYESGYRWASSQAAPAANSCALDSRSFQRGCEAAFGDRDYSAI